MPPKVAQMIKEQEKQKIFKEFEELGYKIQKSVMGFNNIIYISNIENMSTIVIDTKNKLYSKHYTISFDSSMPITLQEHQLLHKLFEIWGWI